MSTTLQPAVTLTDEQHEAVKLAVEGIKSNRPMTRIGGYAGTGKTTIIHEILRQSDRALDVCAYTGKAACVLRNKGIPGANTIHSTIYKPHEVEKVDEKTGKRKIVVEFGRIPKEELLVKGFIIDEASMVGKEILDDLVSFGLPIVAVGDPGQLPPISKYDVNLMLNPDVVLQKIHRQAAESGIIRLATEIRMGGSGFLRRLGASNSSSDVEVVSKFDAREDEKADVFITGYNRTRAQLNQLMRRRLGRKEVLEPGERVICLANDKNLLVFNGLMGTVVEYVRSEPRKLYPRGEDPIDATFYLTKVLWDGELKPREMWLSSAAIGVEKPDASLASAHFGDAVMADYGYAITCHKSQGSQWDRVVVMNEAAPKLWDQTRWLYTAVTRAAKTLVVGN